MRNKNFLSFVMICACLLLSWEAKAQTTIGTDSKPSQAAVLQLKQRNPITPATDNSNADKGLGLPRVELVSLTTLEPFIQTTASDYEAQKKAHQGLTVFNLKKDPINGLETCPYTWDGAVWKEYLMRPGEFKLDVTPADLQFNFDVKNPTPLNLNIQWEPSFIPCSITFEHAAEGGLKGIDALPAQTDISGNYNLSILPIGMTNQEIEDAPYLERHTYLAIRASDGAGKFLTKSIKLNQISYGLKMTGMDPYMELDREYTLSVSSNTAWTLTITDPTGGAFAIQDIPTDGTGVVKTDGSNYKFKLKNDPTMEGKVITFTFSSNEGKFADRVYKFIPTRTYPNAYIIKPGDTQIIPLNKAYIVWANDQKQTLPANATVTAELLWQDTLSIINNISVIGTGIDTKLIVSTRANASKDGGNALVAAKINGEVCWSWHLWVTDYNPDLNPSSIPVDFSTLPTNSTDSVAVRGGQVYSYYNTKIATKFMDRDLGALKLYAGAKETNLNGAYYQYGRKDPFPGPDMTFAILNSTFNKKTLYDINNTKLVHGNPDPGPGIDGIVAENVVPMGISNMIPLSIKNPKTYYPAKTSQNDYDWYGSFVDNHRADLWVRADNTKGLYDPCPAGWRVPIGGVGKDNPFYGIPAILPYNKMMKDARGYVGYLIFSGTMDCLTMGKYSVVEGANLSRLGMAADARSFTYYTLPTSVILNNMNARSHAYAVRCAKDE